MNTQRYLLGSIILFVYFNLIEWLIHGVILEGLYVGRPERFRLGWPTIHGGFVMATTGAARPEPAPEA